MTDISEINRAIISGNFTNDQLTSITDAVKFARAQIAQKNKYTLTVGTKVQFTNNRSGKIVFGSVEKVNRKFIMVRENGYGMWRVPANMLSAA
jgi:hypothetical protein